MEFKRNQLETFRKELRWSQVALAKKIGVNRKTISNWEKGVTIPSDRKIFELANVLGVSIDTISDAKTKHKTEINLNKATISWMSLFKEKDEAKKEIHHISNIMEQLHNKLNNASIIITGIMSSVHFPVYIKNTSHKYIMTNDAFRKNILLEDEPSLYKKMFLKTDYDLFTKEEAKNNFDEDLDVMLSNKPIIDREDYMPGTRKKKWGLTTKVPIHDENNQIAGVVGVFVDITDRKNEEKRRVILERALNNVPLFVWLKEIETEKIVFVNNYLSSLFNLNKSEIYSDSQEWQKFRNSELLKDRNEKLDKSENFPVSYKFEGTIDAEKEKQFFRENIFECEDKYQIGVIEDITERQKLEQVRSDLLNLNKISEDMVTSSRFDEKTKSWKVEYINAAILNISGIDADNIVDDYKIWRNIIHPDDKDKFSNWYDSPEYPKELEYRIIHAKTVQVVWLHHKQYRDENKLYSIVKDITDRKKLEQKNRDLIDYNEIFINYLDSSIEAYFIQEVKPNEHSFFVSDGYAELYGCPKKAFYEDSFFWKKFVHPDDLERTSKEFEFYVKHFNKKMMEDKKIRWRIINNFGVEMNIECTLTTISKSTGKVIVVGSIRVLEQEKN